MMLFLLLPRLVLGKCSQNPYLLQFQTLLFSLNTNISQYNKYIAGTPKDQNLQVCSQFNIQSCCTVEFESFLQGLVTAYENQMQDQYFQLEDITKQLEVNVTKCSFSRRVPFEQSGIGRSQLQQYQSIIRKIVILKGDFLRGSLCILCTTYDNANYFEQGTYRIYVNAANYESYKSQLVAALQDLQKSLVGFRDYLLQYFSTYADTLSCAQVLEDMLDVMSRIQVCPGSDCALYVSQTVEVFENRILAEVDYFSPKAEGGLMVYLKGPRPENWGIRLLGLVIFIINFF